jgi:hypothetical protein
MLWFYHCWVSRSVGSYPENLFQRKPPATDKKVDDAIPKLKESPKPANKEDKGQETARKRR